MNRDANDLKVTIDQCPHCNVAVKAESMVLFGDLDCPECSKALWFLTAANSARFFDHAASEGLRNRTLDFVAERLEIEVEKLASDPKAINELDNDSLETLELLMDLEEELGLV